MQQQQHWARSSVAALMAKRPSDMEAALILSRPVDLAETFALLPARKGKRQ